MHRLGCPDHRRRQHERDFRTPRRAAALIRLKGNAVDKVYCYVILDTYSHRVVVWSIDSSPTGALATSAIGMAIDSRLDTSVEPGTMIRSDQGVQFGAWAFTKRARDALAIRPSRSAIPSLVAHPLPQASHSSPYETTG
ncbi:DDE-type integrase/transposase/recombinase [Brevibacterium aurantiacum]